MEVRKHPVRRLRLPWPIKKRVGADVVLLKAKKSVFFFKKNRAIKRHKWEASPSVVYVKNGEEF